MKCIVKYCGRNREQFPGMSFHRFPSESITRSLWIKFCRLDFEASEIKPSTRVCSAHFDEACFYFDKKGNKCRIKDAVPSIEAFLLDPESDDDRVEDYFKSRPLYSSPALQDHNYANLTAVVPDWADSEEFSDCGDNLGNEPIFFEEQFEVGCGLASGVEQDIEIQSDPIEIHHMKEAAAEKDNSFKLFRVANKWKERAKKWRSNALYWKKKYKVLNSSTPVLQKLKKIYRKDQMDVVFGRIKKVRKWTNETLIEGLQTRFACGRGYDKVRQLPYVALPSYSCLLDKIKFIHFDTGILHEVFDLLQHKVSTMKGNEFDCGIILDEMSIDEASEFCTNNQKYFGTTTMPPSEELASHGLVFMLAGIDLRWKQIIAYEFTGNSIPKGCLKSVVDKIIWKAESIGLRVHFVTSDCGACNKSMWLDYGVSTKKTTIQNDLSIAHPVDSNRRLEFIPDPVHIFKNAVHGWISNAVIVLPTWYVEQKGLTSNEVRRDHLTQLVTYERDLKLKMAHKLTETDVDFENAKTSKVDKMKVSNSTKYCNHSVAAALNVLSDDAGYSELKTSAVFLEDLARWFDLMSSRTNDDALQLSNRAEYDLKISHLEMMVKLIAEIKVGVDCHWKPWQAAFVMATKAILRIQSKLLTDSGYSILYTSRFTQDCVENLFSVVRSKQRRPTALQFKSHLRTITLSQYMQDVRNSSYDVDDREYLSGFVDYINNLNHAEQSTSTLSTTHSKEILDFSNTDILTMAKQLLSEMNNAEANALFHVAGYVMGSIRKKNSACMQCLRGCSTEVPFDKSFGKFSSLLANARGRSYCYASEQIFHFVTCMDSIINQYFSDKSIINKHTIIDFQKSLMSLPIQLQNCHNLKMKLVKRFLQFKIKSDRVRKMRKRKFDSRSMLN